MEKTHHVFITVKEEELFKVIHEYFKRIGALKDVPKDAEFRPFDENVEVCLEYQWEEKLVKTNANATTQALKATSAKFAAIPILAR